MASQPTRFREYKFYEQRDVYALEPIVASATENKDIILFHRDAGSIELVDQLPTFLTSPTVHTSYGLIGLIRLLAGDYLILITGRKLVGELLSQPIYKVTDTKVFPFARNNFYLTLDDEERYVAYVNDFLSSAQLYYSTGLDLTNSFQNNKSLNKEKGWSLSDTNKIFCWNSFHLQPFQEITKMDPNQDFSRFFTPIIYGFISIESVNVNGHDLTYAMISRRAWTRVGARFISRGVDDNGYVSNFVETEQIVISNGTILALNQIRGSIPIYWAQVTNLKYTPKLAIDHRPETVKVFHKHFKQLNQAYGSVVCVNLINKVGYEKPMGDKFLELMGAIQDLDIEYNHFDFHKECSKMRWDRIQLLIDQLAPHLDKHNYFLFQNGQVLKQQSGIIRTSCMDCLDRTNVVQSMVAKAVLLRQLRDINIVTDAFQLNDFSAAFDQVFRNMWADNADAISIAYSGTGALKTDFTRTGRRTQLGLLQDGYNSLIRYFKANFLDGQRQDSVDLFLGKYRVQQHLPSPFQYLATTRFYTALALGLIAFATSTADLLGLIPSQLKSLAMFMYCAMFVVSGYLAKQYGREFVDRPHLIPFYFDSDAFLSGQPKVTLTESHKVVVEADSSSFIDRAKKE